MAAGPRNSPASSYVVHQYWSNLANFSQNWPQLGQICRTLRRPNLPRIGQTLGDFYRSWSDVGQIWPASVHIRSKSLNISAIRKTFDRIRAKIHRFRANICRNCAEFGQICLDSVEILPICAVLWPILVKLAPTLLESGGNLSGEAWASPNCCMIPCDSILTHDPCGDTPVVAILVVVAPAGAAVVRGDRDVLASIVRGPQRQRLPLLTAKQTPGACIRRPAVCLSTNFARARARRAQTGARRLV